MFSAYDVQKRLEDRPRRKAASQNCKSTTRVTFRPEFVEITGDKNSALMLSQAVYWHWTPSQSGNGSFYKSPKEWHYEIGLSRFQVCSARARLAALGLLKYKVLGRPKKTYYWVNVDLLMRMIDKNREKHDNPVVRT